MKAENFPFLLLLQLVSGFPSSGINRIRVKVSKYVQHCVLCTKNKNDKIWQGQDFHFLAPRVSFLGLVGKKMLNEGSTGPKLFSSQAGMLHLPSYWALAGPQAAISHHSN